MGQKQTSVAERNQMIDLKLKGFSLPEIAEATGWRLNVSGVGGDSTEMVAGKP